MRSSADERRPDERAPTPAVRQVRGVLAERIVVSTPLDPFLSLRALAGYSGLSIRKLRDFLEQPQHPLACYRVGGRSWFGAASSTRGSPPTDTTAPRRRRHRERCPPQSLSP
jgi:hypothetical protein